MSRLLVIVRIPGRDMVEEGDEDKFLDKYKDYFTDLLSEFAFMVIIDYSISEIQVEYPKNIELSEEDKEKQGGIVGNYADKPPLGIISEQLWKEQRFCELNKAIKAYTPFWKVPTEWIGELQKLRTEIKAFESSRA